MSDYFKSLEAASDKASAGAVAGAPSSVAPEGTPAPAVDAPPAQDAPTRGFLADTAVAVGGGIESAVRGTAQTVLKLGEMSPIGQAAKKATGLFSNANLDNVTERLDAAVPKLFDEPQYFVNKLVKGVVDFAVALRAGRVALPLDGLKAVEGASAAAKIGKETSKLALQQGAGSMLTRDAHSERAIGDLIEAHPSLQGHFTDWLASDPNDTVAAGKLKVGLEDTLGMKAGGLVFGYAALGLSKAAPAMVERLFGKSTEKVAAELDTELQKFAESHPSVERYPEKLASPDDSLDLFKANPKFRHIGREEVNTKDITLEHTLDERGTERAFQYADQYRTGQPVKDLVVRRDPDGKLFAMSGNARTVGAGQAGKDKLFADVFEDTAAQSEKLKGLQEQAGGPAKLDKLVNKAEATRGAFEAKPEVLQEFNTRMKELGELGYDEQLPFLKQVVQQGMNYSKISTTDDVYYTLEQMAQLVEPTVRKAGVKEYQSFKDIQATSNLFGAKPEAMMESMRSWGVDAAKMPAMLRAARVWQASLADDIIRDARATALESGGQTATISALGKIQALHELTAMVSTIKTSTARTLNSLKMVVKPTYTKEEMQSIIDASGGDARVKLLLDKLGMAKSPAEVQALTKIGWMSKVMDVHNELWVNALLSGPSTHVVNLGTASMNLFMKPAMRSLGGAIAGDFSHTKDAVVFWRALGSNIRDSWNMAKRAYEIERPILAAADKQLEISPTISAANFGMDGESFLGNGVNQLGRATRLTSRLLTGEDEFMKQLSYRAHVQMEADRKAMDLLKAGQLSDTKMVERVVNGKTVQMTEFDAFTRDEFNKAFETELLKTGEVSQGAGTNAEALQYANESTFTQSLKVPVNIGTRSFSEMAYQFANSQPLLRGTMLPFVKVPANLMREGMQYTPGLNLLQRQFQENLRAGGAVAAEARGKLALSGFTFVSGIWLATNGFITGAEPTDPDIRRTLKDTGWQPYSFVLPDGQGGKKYIPFNRLDPYGMPWGLIADTVQTLQHIDSTDGEALAGAMVLSMSNLINSKGYLKGVTDTMDILTGGHGDAGVQKAERILRNYASSHVPNILKVGELSQEVRDVRNMLDAFQARVPGFSENVPAKRNYLGDKVMAPVGWPWHALLPSKPTSKTDDPVLLELGRLADGPSATRFKLPASKVGEVDLTAFKNAEGQTAYERMMEHLKEGGFHQALADLIEKPSYQSGTDGDRFHTIGSKVVDIKRLEQKYHRAAMKEMRREFPEVDELMKADDKAARQMKHGRTPDEIDLILQFGQ